jgi:hypothetical protein
VPLTGGGREEFRGFEEKGPPRTEFGAITRRSRAAAAETNCSDL